MSRFAITDRVLLEHPRYGRHYGEIVGRHEHEGLTEAAWMVQVPSYVNAWPVLESWMREPAGARDAVIGDILDVGLLKAVFEKPFAATLWGQPRGMKTPHVCDCSFGDGLKLLRLTTINSRPNYYVLRVDSGWDVHGDGNGEPIGDHIDDVLEAIAEECGQAGAYLEEPCPECEDTICYCEVNEAGQHPWPALDDRDGSSWAGVHWWEVFGDDYRRMIGLWTSRKDRRKAA